jgi:serine/threonine-protein kinase
MLTTERLFRRPSDFEAMQAIVHDDVPPPSSLRPDIPPDVDAIVMKLLAKAPADRYQTADELNEAIEAVAVRTGSAISAASLGRYMRELFGQRPEPWIELQSVETHPEQFTVTSEPIPSVGDFSISAADMLDVRLEAVPDLSAKPLLRADPDLAPTMRTPPATPFHTPSAGMPQLRSHAPSSSQSNPQYPVLSSSSHAAFVGRPSAANLETKRSKLPLILMPALLLGVILGVALALGSSGGKKAPTAHVTMPPPDKPVVMPTTRAEPPPVVVAEAPAPVAPVDKPAPAADPPPPDVATLYKDHQYADVVSACNASKATLAANATACTVAACKQREVSKARRWFASVTSKRANVKRECGTILPAEKPAADDECKRDPLACQH